MNAAHTVSDFPAFFAKNGPRPLGHYRCLLPRPSPNAASVERRRSMAMAWHSTTFYNPVLDKNYRHPVDKPSSYRDPTGAKQQAQARAGVRVNPPSAAKTAGAKGKGPMRPAPSRGGGRRRDLRSIAYGYTGNPLEPEPW